MAEKIACTIEHHAVLFGLLAKYAVRLCKDAGTEAILTGMTRYGNERGQRMAANALAAGDELTTLTSQAYGEWHPDYNGQMIFGRIRTQPTLQTYISKCAWCEAWQKHNLTEYGKLYCVNVDNAVYQGFQNKFLCTPISTAMSWGGKRCEFDWGDGLTDEEVQALDQKKSQLSTSQMKDFNFHTAHLLNTISKVLSEECPQEAEEILRLARKEFIGIFGPEYIAVFETHK